METADGATTDTTATEGGEGDSAPAWFSEYVQNADSQMAELRQELDTRLPAAQTEPNADPFAGQPYGQPDPYGQYGQQPFGQDPYGQQQPTDIYDPETGEPDPQAAQQFLNQMVQAQMQPLMQQMQQQDQQMRALRNSLDARDLEEQYPELRDEGKAEATMQLAANEAQRIGRPDLATDPAFIELTFLAEKARNSAAQEQPAGTAPEVGLEGAGGGQPQQPEEDPGERIARAYGKPHPIWGVPVQGQ